MFFTIACPDKETRDAAYRSLRTTGNRLERQAVRFTDVEPVMNPQVPGEIVLDAQGRITYRTIWGVAYPEK